MGSGVRMLTRPTRLRLHQVDVNLIGVHAHIVDRSRLDGERHERELQVRMLDARSAADRSPRPRK